MGHDGGGVKEMGERHCEGWWIRNVAVAMTVGQDNWGHWRGVSFPWSGFIPGVRCRDIGAEGAPGMSTQERQS